jgi:nitrite reductase/ring-hydroxylating ferredoxin subunit
MAVTRQLGSSGVARGLGFNELLLIGVILVAATWMVLGMALYVRPADHLSIPELQPTLRIARESEFPIGASRVTNWGDRVVLVVRRGPAEYFALDGISPLDGCILRWDVESLRVLSPCSHLVYDLRGNVVDGLTTQPLERYSVSVRDGIVYVSEN